MSWRRRRREIVMKSAGLSREVESREVEGWKLISLLEYIHPYITKSTTLVLLLFVFTTVRFM